MPDARGDIGFEGRLTGAHIRDGRVIGRHDLDAGRLRRLLAGALQLLRSRA